MSARDGGPAFPFFYQGPTTGSEVYYGMSLRDHFAGLAMQAFCSSEEAQIMEWKPEDIATDAYGMADAMLAAREVKP